jgi:hypothetical protein
MTDRERATGDAVLFMERMGWGSFASVVSQVFPDGTWRVSVAHRGPDGIPGARELCFWDEGGIWSAIYDGEEMFEAPYDFKRVPDVESLVARDWKWIVRDCRGWIWSDWIDVAKDMFLEDGSL